MVPLLLATGAAALVFWSYRSRVRRRAASSAAAPLAVAHVAVVSHAAGAHRLIQLTSPHDQLCLAVCECGCEMRQASASSHLPATATASSCNARILIAPSALWLRVQEPAPSSINPHPALDSKPPSAA